MKRKSQRGTPIAVRITRVPVALNERQIEAVQAVLDEMRAKRERDEIRRLADIRRKRRRAKR